jgi:hypothetical protein
MKHLVLSLALAWAASLRAYAQYPASIQHSSPVLDSMADAASLVAHVRITNISRGKSMTILGTVPSSATCIIHEALKGTPTNGAIILCFELPSAPSVEAGQDYLAFVRKWASPFGGNETYYLVDKWLAIVPFSEALLHDLRRHFVRGNREGEPDGAANRSQPVRSETNRPPSAAGSGR